MVAGDEAEAAQLSLLENTVRRRETAGRGNPASGVFRVIRSLIHRLSALRWAGVARLVGHAMRRQSAGGAVLEAAIFVSVTPKLAHASSVRGATSPLALA